MYLWGETQKDLTHFFAAPFSCKSWTLKSWNLGTETAVFVFFSHFRLLETLPSSQPLS